MFLRVADHLLSSMSVTGECPRCGYEKAQFLNIDSNKNVAVDCPPQLGCDFQAATSLETAVPLINDDEFPIVL
jgi:hypothetical protein